MRFALRWACATRVNDRVVDVKGRFPQIICGNRPLRVCAVFIDDDSSGRSVDFSSAVADCDALGVFIPHELDVVEPVSVGVGV